MSSRRTCSRISASSIWRGSGSWPSPSRTTGAVAQPLVSMRASATVARRVLSNTGGLERVGPLNGESGFVHEAAFDAHPPAVRQPVRGPDDDTKFGRGLRAANDRDSAVRGIGVVEIAVDLDLVGGPPAADVRRQGPFPALPTPAHIERRLPLLSRDRSADAGGRPPFMGDTAEVVVAAQVLEIVAREPIRGRPEFVDT